MRRQVILLYVVLFSQSILCQTFELLPVTNNSICQSTEFTVRLENNSNNFINEAQINLSFNCSQSYIPNTISQASENDITDLSNPIFAISNIGINNVLEFSFQLDGNCLSSECIESGVFPNIDLQYLSDTDTINTNFNYEIETPLLLITDITDPVMVGAAGDTLIRLIKIENTRPGILESFLFTDKYEDGIEVIIDQGALISQNDNFVSVQFDQTFFQTIGNGNDFFEKDEVIIVTEKIVLEVCDFEERTIPSRLSTIWQCSDSNCEVNEDNKIAIINLDDNPNEGPNLIFEPFQELPECLCNIDPTIQGLKIKNTSTVSSANDIVIEIEQTILDVGLLENDVEIIIDGESTFISVTPTQPIEQTCNSDLDVFQIIRFLIPEVLPDQEIIVQWNHLYCFQDAKNSKKNEWVYRYNYQKDCANINDDFFSGVEEIDVSQEYSINSNLNASFFGTLGKIDTIEYAVESPLLSIETGILSVNFVVPCLMTIQGADWMLGNALPIEITIENIEGNNIIGLSYQLPLDTTFASLIIPIEFTCLDNCNTFITDQELNTSCENNCGEKDPSTEIGSTTTLTINETCADNCLLIDCKNALVPFDCLLPLEIIDIPGYVNIDDFKIKRSNIDLPDNNNNGCSEPDEFIDLNLIRQDRFVAGDTMQIDIASGITLDNLDSTYQNVIYAFRLGLSGYTSMNQPKSEIEFRKLIAENNGMRLIGSSFTIKDQDTNSEYFCDQIPVNYDQGLALPYFELSVNDLTHCDLPLDYRFDDGDSIFAELLFEIEYNFDCFSGLYGTMDVGLSASAYLHNEPAPSIDNLYSCSCESSTIQVANIKHEINGSNSGRIEICQGSIENGGFNKEILFGVKAGFFPFEHRRIGNFKSLQIAQVEGLEDPDVTLTSYIIDQESSATPMSLEASSIIEAYEDIFGGTAITGYNVFEIEALKKSEWQEHLELSVIIDYQNKACRFESLTIYPKLINIEVCTLGETDPQLITQDNALNGMKPFLKTLYDNFCSLTSFNNKYTQVLEIFNATNLLSSDAENAWLRIISPTNKITDFKLINTENGQVINSTNSIFQLGQIDTGDTLKLEIRGVIKSCVEEDVIFINGWSCEPYVELSQTPCEADTSYCSVLAPLGALEMTIDPIDQTTQLCEAYETISLEIFNPDLGATYDIQVEANLIQGLEIVPGSSQIEFPKGSNNFYTLDEPIITNNIARWNVISNSIIFPNGLSGTNDDPNDALTFSFETIPNCNFLSGGQITFLGTAISACNSPLNKVARLGPRLFIDSNSIPYEAEINATNISIEDCIDELELDVTIILPNDNSEMSQVSLILPDGLSFESSNCSSGFIDCNPTIIDNILSWELLANQSSFDFTLQLSGAANQACNILSIPIFTSYNINANCTSIDSTCAIQILTAEETIDIKIEKPALLITEIENIQVNDNGFDIEMNIENTGLTQIKNFIVDLYFDEDNSGDLTLGDILFESVFVEKTISPSFDRDVEIENIEVPQDRICDIVMVIDENKNCLCSGDEVRLIPDNINFNEQILVCSNQAFTIGPDNQEGYSYNWLSGIHTDCPSCSMTEFAIQNNTSNVITEQITLEIFNGLSCNQTITYNILVNPEPGILNVSNTICLGDSITLFASNGTSFEWGGPNLENTTEQEQIVTPIQSSTYFLSVTDALGCVGVDTIEIIVLDIPVADAGADINACYGQDIFLSAVTNENYQYNWSPSINLDNPISANPQLVNSSNNTYILEVTNGNCTNTDTVNVQFEDNISIDYDPILTQCKEEIFTISLDSSYHYNWTPSYINMCQNESCSQVELQLIEDQAFTVHVEDQNGCKDTLNFEIDVIGLSTTDVFENEICEGGQFLFNGVFYFDEGIHCDTTINSLGCPIVQCLDLKVLPNIQQLEQLQICNGDSILSNGIIIKESGLYCFDFVSFQGCDSTYCLEVIKLSDPEIIFESFASIVDEGSQIQLFELSDHAEYIWEENPALSCTDCPNPILTVDSTLILTLTVIDSNGCMNTEVIEIEVREGCRIENLKIPDAITPDGNNKNDRFRIVNFRSDAIEVTIEVFNRWGEKVYKENGNTGWDGNYKNEPAPEGVYLYIIDVLCPNGRTQTIHGDLTILR